MTKTWLIRAATGEFISDCFTPSTDATLTTVIMPADVSIDIRSQRYDATSTTGLRDATAQELMDYDSAARDVLASEIDSNQLIQAVAQLDFEERQKLQVKAGQTLLTAAQAKARVKAIYKALLS